MTGVPVTPIVGALSPQPSVAFGSNGAPSARDARIAPVSPSSTYRSFASVATKTLPFATSGCAYTCSLAVKVSCVLKSRPKAALPTIEGSRPGWSGYQPVRCSSAAWVIAPLGVTRARDSSETPSGRRLQPAEAASPNRMKVTARSREPHRRMSGLIPTGRGALPSQTVRPRTTQTRRAGVLLSVGVLHGGRLLEVDEGDAVDLGGSHGVVARRGADGSAAPAAPTARRRVVRRRWRRRLRQRRQRQHDALRVVGLHDEDARERLEARAAHDDGVRAGRGVEEHGRAVRHLLAIDVDLGLGRIGHDLDA